MRIISFVETVLERPGLYGLENDVEVLFAFFEGVAYVINTSSPDSPDISHEVQTSVREWTSFVNMEYGDEIRVDFYPNFKPNGTPHPHAGKISTAYPINTPVNP